MRPPRSRPAGAALGPRRARPVRGRWPGPRGPADKRPCDRHSLERLGGRGRHVLHLSTALPHLLRQPEPGHATHCRRTKPPGTAHPAHPGRLEPVSDPGRGGMSASQEPLPGHDHQHHDDDEHAESLEESVALRRLQPGVERHEQEGQEE